MSKPSEDDSRLLALRDRLVDELEESGVRGIVSAGLGRIEDRPALVLLVQQTYQGGAPRVFNGTPVLVREMKAAVA